MHSHTRSVGTINQLFASIWFVRTHHTQPRDADYGQRKSANQDRAISSHGKWREQNFSTSAFICRYVHRVAFLQRLVSPNRKSSIGRVPRTLQFNFHLAELSVANALACETGRRCGLSITIRRRDRNNEIKASCHSIGAGYVELIEIRLH